MSSTEERLAYLASQNPAFMASLGSVARAQAEGPLDSKTVQLVYLGALAALGAEASFKVHLDQALGSGITEEEALQAALCTFTAGGITPILKVIGAFLPS